MTTVAFPTLLTMVLVPAEMLTRERFGKQKIDWHDLVFKLNSDHLIVQL